MLKPVKVAVFGALALSLATTGCNRVTNNPGGGSSSGAGVQAIVIDYTGTIKGPAPDVPGAKTGGTITVLRETDFEWLDPQEEYVGDALNFSMNLFHRTLTGYIENNKGEPLKLVGDLATSAGETTDNGKTWKYTLRDNIKFEDGTPITSKDIAYGIGRALGPDGIQGPQYVNQIMNKDGAYKGPKDKNDLPPGVTTPDDKTLIFTLPTAAPDWPFLMAYPTSTPVPADKDTHQQYTRKFSSTGPYKIKNYTADAKLELEKNPNWDPTSDPIRKQYVDSVVFEFGADGDSQTNRLKAAAGADATAVMDANVSPSLIADVKADPAVMSRVDTSITPFVNYLYINTQVVTDVNVRKALIYAFDPDAYIKAVGGYDVADPATTIMSPTLPGFKKFNAYAPTNGGVNGDVEKAKQLLGGTAPAKIEYCFANTAINQTVHATIQAGLARAGFTFASKPLDPASYYTTVGDKTTTCGIISGGWAADNPDPKSTMDVLMNGTLIVPKGNNNLAYLNDPAVNQKLAELNAMPDRAAAAPLYGDLDKQIMETDAPLIPTRYIKNFTIAGPNVGSTFVSPLFAAFNLATAYVK